MDSQVAMGHYLTDWTKLLSDGGSKGGRLYHGTDCVHMLVLLRSRSGLFNRVNAVAFKYSGIARFLHSIFRAGRNLLHHLRSRTPLHLV
jgi:hypothetical protein